MLCFIFCSDKQSSKILGSTETRCFAVQGKGYGKMIMIPHTTPREGHWDVNFYYIIQVEKRRREGF